MLYCVELGTGGTPPCSPGRGTVHWVSFFPGHTFNPDLVSRVFLMYLLFGKWYCPVLLSTSSTMSVIMPFEPHLSVIHEKFCTGLLTCTLSKEDKSTP